MAMIKASLSLLIWLNENVQSLLSLLPKLINLMTVLVLVRVEPFDVVRSLRCAVIQSGEITEKDKLLLDGSQPCVVVGDDTQCT